ncbi:penicillin-binding transpeptidase domain-containing protein [Hymenobacter chitinivorans]|uniref:Beta-lactamase class D n=1 Tax=Hymenobacter chitinivorans DSM 11115 TaxID=1121954 RepID=A0A2M9AQU1_9BACT|nr:penicillin-binding transpeptidase domain-containing protein [Hymenobacter chitinivorans]PJJ48076.1 beta-lactamase class D [Hymenobacter chitinivorans DSM 11115]
MRFLALFLLLLSGLSARGQALTERDFKKYFDSYGLRGSFLLYDQKANRYTAYDVARCNQGYLPGATFNIPNVLIGLETGVLPDTSFVFPAQDQKRDDGKLAPAVRLGAALRQNCQPCMQQIAQEVGVPRYQQALLRLKFGQMVVTPEVLQTFWMGGISRISQFQMVTFLRHLYAEKLPPAPRNQALTKRLFLLKSTPQYKLYGASGWTQRAKLTNGWFVGWLEQGGNVYLFALNAEPKDGKPADEKFITGRQIIAEQILQELALLPN